MTVLTAVLKDLYIFTFVYGFGFKKAPSAKRDVVSQFTEAVERAAPDLSLLEPPPSTDVLIPEILSSSVVLQSKVGTATEAVQEDVRFESIGYAFVPDTLLYALPTRSFDGVIDRLQYGDSFQILNTQGKWCNVLYDDIRGWIHSDDVTQSQAALNPQFVSGEVYDAEHETTVRLRTLIDDAFHAAQLANSLQDVEYVTYKLSRKGRRIAWGTERPRIAGTWQRLLKGVRGVHLGVNPKTGSVMEYIKEDNTGHVAYVESVFPDGGVAISEIGYPSESVYSERTLAKEEWKELRPIFIEVA